MQKLRYIELYEDGIIQRRVSVGLGGSRMLKKDQSRIIKKLHDELLKAAKRNPEKVYWMELRTE